MEDSAASTGQWRRLFISLGGLGLALAFVSGQALAQPKVVDARLDRFSFGSCNDEDDPQHLWAEVLRSGAQAFFWGGDVIYADTTDLEKMARKYRKQLSHPEYQSVRQSLIVDGVWDDHDYCCNNAGGEQNPIREEAKRLFLDFMGEPSSSPRREQPGVYVSYLFGPPGQQAKVISLDGRYNRDSPLNLKGDFLGEEQWKWLESELANSPAKMHFIVSGISVLSRPWLGFEQWRNFPQAFKRLFDLIERHRVPGVMFLTGDRHFAGFLQSKVRGRRYYDLMSSGFNQQIPAGPGRWFMTLLYGGRKNASFEHNVGFVAIDWEQTPVRLHFTTLQTEKPARVKKEFALVNGAWVLR